jgi:hypothetical protein
VKPTVYRRPGLISGVLLALYVAAKAIDSYVWLNVTSGAVGFGPADFYSHWPPSSMFLFSRDRAARADSPDSDDCAIYSTEARVGAVRRDASMLNRFVMTVQTLALPTLSFDPFLKYTPSWQEVATFAGVIAYGVIVYSLSYQYLSLFEAPKGADKNVSLDRRIPLDRDAYHISVIVFRSAFDHSVPICVEPLADCGRFPETSGHGDVLAGNL